MKNIYEQMHAQTSFCSQLQYTDIRKTNITWQYLKTISWELFWSQNQINLQIECSPSPTLSSDLGPVNVPTDPYFRFVNVIRATNACNLDVCFPKFRQIKPYLISTWHNILRIYLNVMEMGEGHTSQRHHDENML